MPHVAFVFSCALLVLFVIGTAGECFAGDNEQDGCELLSLYRGLLLTASLAFLSYILPFSYPFLFCFYLLFFAYGLKKSGGLWIRKPVFSHYFLFFLYLFLWQCLFPFYYGGNWYGDWFEHYERVLFFLHQKPMEYSFLGLYGILSRTPFFHLIQSFFLHASGISFLWYQALSTMLNSLFFIPFFLFLSKMKKERFRFLLYLSPYILRMATYLFPKALAAFFVLSAFYVFFYGRKGKKYMDAGLLFGCAAMTHPSGIFYFLALCLVLLRERHVMPALKMTVFAFLPLLPWLFYAGIFFSMRELVAQSPSFSYAAAGSAANFLVMKFHNVIGAFVPVVFLYVLYTSIVSPAVTDYFMRFLDVWNRWLNFAHGALPAVWTLSFTVHALKKKKRQSEDSIFPRWIILFVVPFAFLCDVLTVNNAGVPSGVAQNGMMPLVLFLGLYWMEGVDVLPLWTRAGILAEYFIGFAAPFGYFLSPVYFSGLVKYFKDDALLAYGNKLVFLYDDAQPWHFILLCIAAGMGIFAFFRLGTRSESAPR